MSRMEDRRAGDGAKPTRGNTVTAQGETQEPRPRMPHEQDESADSQAAGEPTARRIGGLAHDDVAEGRVDTDKGPVLDATYERQKGGEEKQRRQ